MERRVLRERRNIIRQNVVLWNLFFSLFFFFLIILNQNWINFYPANSIVHDKRVTNKH